MTDSQTLGNVLKTSLHIAAEDLLGLLLPSLKAAFADYIQFPDRNNNERVGRSLLALHHHSLFLCQFVRLSK